MLAEKWSSQGIEWPTKSLRNETLYPVAKNIQEKFHQKLFGMIEEGIMEQKRCQYSSKMKISPGVRQTASSDCKE